MHSWTQSTPHHQAADSHFLTEPHSWKHLLSHTAAQERRGGLGKGNSALWILFQSLVNVTAASLCSSTGPCSPLPHPHNTPSQHKKVTSKYFTLPEILQTRDLLYQHLPLSLTSLSHVNNGDYGSLVNKSARKNRRGEREVRFVSGLSQLLHCDSRNWLLDGRGVGHYSCHLPTYPS